MRLERTGRQYVLTLDHAELIALYRLMLEIRRLPWVVNTIQGPVVRTLKEFV